MKKLAILTTLFLLTGAAPIDTIQVPIEGVITMETFKEVVAVLQQAEKEHKPVIINIDSQGGLVIAGQAIMKALNQTKAEVTCKVDKYAASAAADILVACKNRIVDPKAVILFHLPFRTIKDVGDVRTYSDSKDMEDFLTKNYGFENIFTNMDDLHRYLMGGDVTYTGFEFNNNAPKLHHNKE